MHRFKRFAYFEITILMHFFVSVYASLDACYDTLRIRSEPETCIQSTDCYDANAECIYSLAESHHICCKPRPNAIFPECPDGRKILIMGKYMPVLCSLENSIENDMCPQGYECLPSVTTFTRNNEQSYNICCTTI